MSKRGSAKQTPGESPARQIIGVDFDNTIVSYDALFHAEASSLGLIPPGTPVCKKDIRDSIRTNHNDLMWQKLQGIVYGPGMKKAVIMPGVEFFLNLCKEKAVKVYIVSHKTRFASLDPAQTDLWQASMEWLTASGLFDNRRFALSEHNIFFESSRTEKINRISQLQCSHFIDDLEEVLLDASFAADIDKILLSKSPAAGGRITTCSNWREIAYYVFGENCNTVSG